MKIPEHISNFRELRNYQLPERRHFKSNNTSLYNVHCEWCNVQQKSPFISHFDNFIYRKKNNCTIFFKHANDDFHCKKLISMFVILSLLWKKNTFGKVSDFD